MSNVIIAENIGLAVRGDEVNDRISYSIAFDNSVSDWTGSDWEDTNLIADPEFVDPEGGDFRLEADSPAVDAGSPAAVYNDVDGTRNDIGAYGGPGGGW